MAEFILDTPMTPKGDQEKAINEIVEKIESGTKEVTLLGATGTGKTFTIANVIKRLGKKTLVLAHNKTLAGQLYMEFKNLFPHNRVEYFISYYDYYQPEAYVVSSDTYIEKEATINEEIDRLRNSATASLLERDDVIVVASVSCIYGIGSPDSYENQMIVLRKGDELNRKSLINKLSDAMYERTNSDLRRGTFRLKGDIIDIMPPYMSDKAIRVEYDFDEIVSIKEIDALTAKVLTENNIYTIYPATQFATDKATLNESLRRIEEELKERIKYFEDKNMPLEAERIRERTRYDIEMLREVGSCQGIENYSRHLSLKGPGETPYTLLDYLGDDYLIVIDESHVTVPQVRGMFNGDRSRKTTLVDYGFRLPSALDNRPLNFDEFEKRMKTVIYMSATPGEYELERSPVVEQIIRPSYLLDPMVKIRPTNHQIDDVVKEVNKTVKEGFRVLITTLTIKMSEDLTAYLRELGFKVAYLHSEIKALERLEIIRKLRLKEYDVLVGINLLREGLDIPEVSKILILDADKEGFLRSSRSLIQTIGRAARNENGEVILYADHMTDSIKYAVDETMRRRQIQEEYNKAHNVVPHTIVKEIGDELILKEETKEIKEDNKLDYSKMSPKERERLLDRMEKEMLKAAKVLDFERAMELRDAIFEVKKEIENL
ncbi:MAG: excinuclease ABC subunit UvrB [Gammaproteobacteria bacterium]|nr:excinuclease ABC subunit UvrB [Gammaproteobacteria bacterium]